MRRPDVEAAEPGPVEDLLDEALHAAQILHDRTRDRTAGHDHLGLHDDERRVQLMRDVPDKLLQDAAALLRLRR